MDMKGAAFKRMSLISLIKGARSTFDAQPRFRKAAISGRQRLPRPKVLPISSNASKPNITSEKHYHHIVTTSH